MLKNYIRLAWRNITRKKLYSIINVTGLGLASAFCILVYWYVQHEQSFDKFHPNEKQLYRFESSNVFGLREKPKKQFFSFMMTGAEQRNMIQTPLILAGELKKDFPEIENAVRIEPGYELLIRANNQSFREQENSAFADENFFRVFNFPLKQGNPGNVLTDRHVVISEKAAFKYFGKENPIGKTLMLPEMDSILYTVSGVMKDFPANSSFRFDFVMPRESLPDYQQDLAKGLNSSSDLLIIQLKKGTNEPEFAQKLDNFCRAYFASALKEWASFPGSEVKPDQFHVFLRPYAEAHYNVSPGWGHYTDLKNIYQLSVLALVIIVIACLNYILLTLTGTVSRSQEVGIRKTIGAARRQIILQFYVETQMLAVFSVLLGWVLAVVSLPLFSSLIGSDLKLDFFSFGEIAGMLMGIAFVLGTLAGIYPALVMSGLKPVNMLRKLSIYKLNPYLSNILAVTQFSVCILLIISSLVISKQIRFMNQTALGFDSDQIVSIQNPYGFMSPMESTLQLRDRLRHYVSTDPALEDFTSCAFPFEGYNNTNNHIINGQKTMVQAFDIDYNYFSFYKIPIIKGRSFSPDRAEDSAAIKLVPDQMIPGSSAARQPVVVNETLYKLLRQPPLNVFNKEIGGPIIGVCRDYHSNNLTQKIGPVYHRISRRYIGYYSIKIKAGQSIPLAMERIKTNWSRLTAGAPFTYRFLDQDVAKSYDNYLRWMRTVTASCLLSIAIACMGLFGLSGLVSISRTKEIGIRKVLGASVGNLFVLLNKRTLVTAAISFAVAIPLAVYLLNEWLQNFAYRIQLGWLLFAVAGIISVITALAAVSYHTLKAAMANPVNSLRTE